MFSGKHYLILTYKRHSSGSTAVSKLCKFLRVYEKYFPVFEENRGIFNGKCVCQPYKIRKASKFVKYFLIFSPKQWTEQD